LKRRVLRLERPATWRGDPAWRKTLTDRQEVIALTAASGRRSDLQFDTGSSCFLGVCSFGPKKPVAACDVYDLWNKVAPSWFRSDTGVYLWLTKTVIPMDRLRRRPVTRRKGAAELGLDRCGRPGRSRWQQSSFLRWERGCFYVHMRLRTQHQEGRLEIRLRTRGLRQPDKIVVDVPVGWCSTIIASARLLSPHPRDR
jgi:hypothetical protein